MQNKVIAITGAASGIGLETAKLLASNGAKVSLADIQDGPLQKVVDDIIAAGGIAFGTVVDVRDRAKVDRWIQKTVETYGALDGAANIAGVAGNAIGIKSIEAVEDDDWDFVIDVNQKGVLNCLRAQIPNIKKGGSIVNASSVAGLKGFACASAYVASKHAVTGLTKTAAKELGSQNIRCNCICPGPIDTPLLRKAEEKMGGESNFDEVSDLKRKGLPKEVAGLVEFLLSEASSYITGTAHLVDGGLVG